MKRHWPNFPKDGVLRVLPTDLDYLYVPVNQMKAFEVDPVAPCELGDSILLPQRVSVLMRTDGDPTWRPVSISRSLYDKIQTLAKRSVDKSE